MTPCPAGAQDQKMPIRSGDPDRNTFSRVSFLMEYPWALLVTVQSITTLPGLQTTAEPLLHRAISEVKCEDRPL
jgi:hypothetical protein